MPDARDAELLAAYRAIPEKDYEAKFAAWKALYDHRRLTAVPCADPFGASVQAHRDAHYAREHAAGTHRPYYSGD